MVKRVFLIVLDSLGIGEEPDAHLFGDEGSNTLGTVAQSAYYHTPNLEKLGLFHIEGVSCPRNEGNPKGSYARMREASKAKDTTAGHWEIAGIVSDTPLPVYPSGFPSYIIDALRKETGRGILCNRPYSGTEVIRDYGRKQEETGDLIVYTSADSVMQIAAHEEVIPVEELYSCCEKARALMTGKDGVGRVIARPFAGKWPEYVRTPRRHDFSLTPPGPTMMDALCAAGLDVWGVGKIGDIFAGKGITKSFPTKNNRDGMERTMALAGESFTGLCFVNLVDFDMVYGHRNDADGYAKAMTEFDVWLGAFISRMESEDVLLITADHGCDPGTPSTDHSREYTPMLIYGAGVRAGVSLGTRNCFGDIGATVLDMFQVKGKLDGKSFWQEVVL